MRIFTFILCVLTCPSFIQAQNIQEMLQAANSAYDEQSPVLSPDGNTLYFTVGNHPSNIGGKKDPGDIWYVRREGGGWSAPVHAGELLNDRAYNAVAGFSADGNQMFLHGHYTAKTQGISVSKQSNGGWSRPENIHVPYFLNKSTIFCGSLSYDNNVFVFSAEGYGTYGVDDIYVTVKQEGKWTEPRNLGNVINTQFQELSPSLSADNRTLYFSSNGRKGRGSFDVYSATRLDDTWMNWTAPTNLGAQVNTEGRELYYRNYESLGLALFTTTTSSDGYGDIRITAPQEPLILKDSTISADARSGTHELVVAPRIDETTPKAEPAPPSNEVRVYGRISNARTGETIPASVTFEGPDVSPAAASSAAEGYSLTVPSADYVIRIEANGYISEMERLTVNAGDMRSLEMNFSLQPVEVGTTVNLKNVLFAQAKTDILPESYPELDLVVQFMKSNPTVRIELMGHTDGRGVQADNVRLSQKRVDRVKEYLVSKGIDAKRITGKGYGGSKPIASNDTEESRRMNRRVEFVIKKF